MNRFEKLIYGFVKNNPRIKNSVRDAYQLLMNAIPVEQKVINNSMIARPGFFFGFHDKSPWSGDDQYMLGNRFTMTNRKIKSTDSIEVGIFKGERYDLFEPIAVTSSFNWQQ